MMLPSTDALCGKWHCECGKAAFATEDAALRRMKAVAKKGGKKRKPTRAYWSDLCGAWHLTSRGEWGAQDAAT